MITVLTGGTGGAKLIVGLAREVNPSDLTIICNTADDFVLHGLHISPDIDTIMYQLAGLGDEEKGWGIRGDTFAALGQLALYGAETWFKLGDRDLATHLWRTESLRRGNRLSSVTRELCAALGVEARILPMSDEPVETRVETTEGEISFQDYFVRLGWRPEVKRVYYARIEAARPAAGVVEAIENAAAVIVSPSNPVTSIGPILAVPGVGESLKRTSARVIGVSPIIGKTAISGPAHSLMSAMELEPSALGVARCYHDFLDRLVIDCDDSSLKADIERLGIQVSATAIRMNSLPDKRRLAREVLALARE
ncbi:MAG TPA: 2-phospho-L-lactate transferase [Candidatus Eisenbacteria bacterium]|nr:2-phospho-L-lactate transferase [Candidatus Eisenbacteria bacterium]